MAAPSFRAVYAPLRLPFPSNCYALNLCQLLRKHVFGGGKRCPGRRADHALATERLPDTPYRRSTVWIYFHEYPAAAVYHGGTPAGTKVISLEVNAFKGGHDSASKQALIRQFTEDIRQRAGIPVGDRVPVYILLRDVPESDWGVFGKTTTLDELHRPPAGATAEMLLAHEEPLQGF